MAETPKDETPAVVCNHVIHHCTTWEDKANVKKAIDYARSVGDMGALPMLLENIRWCPNLGDNIPEEPTEDADGTE